MKKFFAAVSVLMLVIVLICSACSAPYPVTSTYTNSNTHTTTQNSTYTYSQPTFTQTVTTTGSWYPTTTNTVGLSVGGAKDITNFRQNINDGYLPMPTDLTYEGLFYDYAFDTGAQQPSENLFSPSYCTAVTRDPLSQRIEYYLSVGLNSNIPESAFQRKKLNLVIVLDTSGSMASDYDRYYYDDSGNQVDLWQEEGTSHLSKIESAKRALITILEQLNPDDSFAIVTYNSGAYLAKPMGQVGSCDLNSIENNIWNIFAGGSTNLDAGIDTATNQFRNLRGLDNYEYENRMIILSDAEPNTGDTSSYGLSNTIKTNADSRIYTTFIGIGVDFNSSLVEQISTTKGANYYSVHSPKQFNGRMEDEFDYMVTPLVFDVSLKLQAAGWKIDDVFGSPQANQSTGELMRIDTLFPAKSSGGEVRGGLVLLKLRKTSNMNNQPIYLNVTYEDRNGTLDGSQATIYMESNQPEYFDNNGIRKGILLVRYASLLKNWMADEHQYSQNNISWDPCISDATGITIPAESRYSQWERTSLPLACSTQYKYLINKFDDYFIHEMNAIGDDSLSQELTVMNEITG